MTTICSIFIQPYEYGFRNLIVGIEGSRVVQINEVEWRRIGLCERVGHCIAGLLLIIPIINMVVFAIFKMLHVSYVHPILMAPPALPASRFDVWLSDPPSSLSQEEIEQHDEEYRNMRLQGEVLIPESPTLEPTSQLVDIAARRQNFINRMRGLETRNFRCTPNVLEFNLDQILEEYSEDPDLARRLSEMHSYAHVGYSHLGWYDRGAQSLVVLKYQSKLFDFLTQKRALFAGHPREYLFKAEIRDIFKRITDSNRNCVDQALSQMEAIMADVIANFKIAREGRGNNPLQDQAAYHLFKYKSDLIRNICVSTYPEEPHMPTLERCLKQSLSRRALGSRGEIFSVGARYGNFLRDREARVQNLVDIFHRGIPGGRNSHHTHYHPEGFLEGLKTYHGPARPLRNNLMLWMRDYFGLGAEDEATTEFARAISEDPDGLPADEGGNLTDAAYCAIMEHLGILQGR